MTNHDQRLRNAWQTAATDLGIRVTVPYVLRTRGGEALYYSVFLPDFGYEAGMVILAYRDESKMDATDAHGLGWSVLDPDVDYDRESFIDMLADWGWNGAEQKAPVWYAPAREAWLREEADDDERFDDSE